MSGPFFPLLFFQKLTDEEVEFVHKLRVVLSCTGPAKAGMDLSHIAGYVDKDGGRKGHYVAEHEECACAGFLV